MKESISSVFLKTVYVIAIVGGLALALSATGFVAAYTYDKVFEGRVLPGVIVGSDRLDGLSYEKAHALIEDSIDTATRNGFVFNFANKPTLFHALQYRLKTQMSLPTFLIAAQMSLIKAAFESGRSHGFVLNALERMRMALYPKRIEIPCTSNTELLKKPTQPLT
jgi:hypothetical protein